jgi:ABC-2 type transport system permease protein
MKKIIDNLILASAIARKDITEALKNKASRTNMLILFGMLLFFYWGSAVRPYDKDMHVAYIDKGSTSLVEVTAMTGEFTYRFREVASIDEMSIKLLNSELGVIFPADFDTQLEANGEATLQGYIPWVHRSRAAELEAKFSQDFSALTGKTIHIQIGENFLQPVPLARNTTPIAIFQYLLVYMALSTIPFLMIEERRSKTMDALLVSPASPGTMVLGKALAGSFYVGVTAVLFFVVYSAYFTNWGMALLAFALVGAFAIGLALLLGSVVKSPQQLGIWYLPIILLIVIPAMFTGEDFLPKALHQIFAWLPSTAMAEIMRFSFSSGVIQNLLWRDIAISAASIALVYAAVVAIVRRSDR